MVERNHQDLDTVDLKILKALQVNGRLSVQDLADQVGLSKTPCLKRLRRLESERFIERYKAVLNRKKIGQDYTTFVQVKLVSTTRKHLDEFCRAVGRIPQIQSCHMMTGGHDFFLKVRTRDMREYRAFLGDVLSELPGVDHTSTFPVMETVKESDDYALPD
jgi:Lrp/AsnC family leucine-responsive transcriptional regulator